jgi:energy-coupling factor transporter ATP-binding protein EcfA2
MRIALIGNSGSGKSTLARQLAVAHSLTALDLDTVAWEPGTVAVATSEDAAAADVGAFCETHERWVIEGCDAGLMRRALEYSPILLFMDPGVDSREGDLSRTAHQAFFDAYRGPKLRLAHVERSLIDDLGARFEACAIPAKEWTHAAHLVVGLWHVHRYGSEDALLRLRSGIRRLNESHGGVNSATDGYHETITAVYVQLLAQYLESGSADMPLSMRAVRLLGSPLAAKDALFTFYSRERLMSTTARAGWVEPDRGPLSAATVLESTVAKQ